MKRFAPLGGAIVWLLLCLSIAAEAAQFVEIRRDAWLYEKPSRDSKRVVKITLAERDGPVLAKLLATAKRNGYYHVRTASPAHEGWIYQSFVRGAASGGATGTRYQRSLYRHWIDDDGDCQNTRTEVLVRDSDPSALRYNGPRECAVARGVWNDPYTGTLFREPRALDIDHFVPLKNAHESGAWQWDAERRRDYANYLRDREHLLAVKASENRRKGDKGPDRYLPPRVEYHCDYVRTWVRIKRDWNLDIPPAERGAIDRVLASC